MLIRSSGWRRLRLRHSAAAHLRNLPSEDSPQTPTRLIVLEPFSYWTPRELVLNSPVGVCVCVLPAPGSARPLPRQTWSLTAAGSIVSKVRETHLAINPRCLSLCVFTAFQRLKRCALKQPSKRVVTLSNCGQGKTRLMLCRSACTVPAQCLHTTVEHPALQL